MDDRELVAIEYFTNQKPQSREQLKWPTTNPIYKDESQNVILSEPSDQDQINYVQWLNCHIKTWEPRKCENRFQNLEFLPEIKGYPLRVNDQRYCCLLELTDLSQ